MQARARHAPRCDTISSYLTWDHGLIDESLSGLTTMIEDGEWERALGHLEEVDQRLRRHIAIEEEIVFPAFERRFGARGPTAVMRAEHDQVTRLLDRMRETMKRRDGPLFADAHGRLLAVLQSHNAKEESMVYPAIDRSLSRGERDELLRRSPRNREP